MTTDQAAPDLATSPHWEYAQGVFIRGDAVDGLALILSVKPVEPRGGFPGGAFRRSHQQQANDGIRCEWDSRDYSDEEMLEIYDGILLHASRREVPGVR